MSFSFWPVHSSFFFSFLCCCCCYFVVVVVVVLLCFALFCFVLFFCFWCFFLGGGCGGGEGGGGDLSFTACNRCDFDGLQIIRTSCYVNNYISTKTFYKTERFLTSLAGVFPSCIRYSPMFNAHTGIHASHWIELLQMYGGILETNWE